MSNPYLIHMMFRSYDSPNDQCFSSWFLSIWCFSTWCLSMSLILMISFLSRMTWHAAFDAGSNDYYVVYEQTRNRLIDFILSTYQFNNIGSFWSCLEPIWLRTLALSEVDWEPAWIDFILCDCCLLSGQYGIIWRRLLPWLCLYEQTSQRLIDLIICMISSNAFALCLVLISDLYD